jgi:anti-sigma factor ChrR (cupin superfamily)
MNPDYNCFPDLAPLYALGVLDETDCQKVEAIVAECPELKIELTEMQATVAAISYTAQPVPMAMDLKKRLFSRIEGTLPQEMNPSTPEQPTTRGLLFDAVRSQDWHWQPYRIPGVQVAILHVDRQQREIVAMLRADAGVRYPVHCHRDSAEEIFVLEGDLIVGEEIYGVGDYIRTASGIVHSPETRGGCLCFIRTSMDDEPVEDVS